MRKVFLSLAVFILILTFTNPGLAKTSLVYWHGFTGPDRPYMEQLIQKFNETHPDIEVKAQSIPWGDLFQQLPAAIAAGQGPDIAAVNEDVITGFIARGAFTPLTPEMMKSANIEPSRFYASLWNIGTYKGVAYGVPVHSVALVTYYNTSLFKAAGIDAAKAFSNRANFVTAMQKLTVDKNGRHPNESGFDATNVTQWGMILPLPWMGGCVFYSTLLQNGGSVVNSDATKATFNSSQAVEALQFLYDLIYKYHISPSNATEDDSVAAFRQAKTAVCLNGVWRVSDYLNQEGLSFSTAPVPRLGTRKGGAWGGSSHLVLPKQNKVDKARQQAALEFIGWMTQPAQNLYWTGAGGLPTQPVVAKDPSFKNSPMEPIFSGLADVQPLSGFPWVSQVRAALDQAVSDVMLAKKSPKKALDDAVSLANQQIKDAMANIR